MIRWCAYCQRYQGEASPYEDYSLTHTICPGCLRERAFLREERARSREIRLFFSDVATARPSLTAQEMLSRGMALGLDPVDLLLGIVQPVLRQIGDRWEQSQITVAEEQRVTALCSSMIALLLETDPEATGQRNCEHPCVLLASAEGNDHVIGSQILEVFLLRHGVSTNVIPPGHTVEEIVALAERHRPRVVGVSAALPEHVDCARRVAEQLANGSRTDDILVVLGGLASESLTSVSPPLITCRNLSDFLALSRGVPEALEAREHRAVSRG